MPPKRRVKAVRKAINPLLIVTRVPVGRRTQRGAGLFGNILSAVTTPMRAIGLKPSDVIGFADDLGFGNKYTKVGKRVLEKSGNGRKRKVGRPRKRTTRR